MKIFLANVLLAITWMFLTGLFSFSNLILGMILGYLAILVARPQEESSGYLLKIVNVIKFIIFFIWELTKANIKVAYEVLTPADNMEPGVVSFNLEAKNDFEITILMNLITLTPGTLSLDVSYDRRCLYIHSMYVEDLNDFRADIKELETRLLEVLR